MNSSINADVERYAAFLTPERHTSVTAPTSDWWSWRAHRVHLLRHSNEAAPARLLVVHGAGAHGAALWPLASALAAGTEVDVTAVDLLLYGHTETRASRKVRYDDWIQLLVDLIAAEDDGRPLVLLGGSIGGLLAVEVAARSGRVAHVAATCLLDPGERAARDQMTRLGFLSRALMPLLHLVRGPLARIQIQISWVAPLARMGRDPKLGRLCATDTRGGAAKVPLGFLASYLRHDHAAALSTRMPVTLMHPERDEWTPVSLSSWTLAALPGPTASITLRECGHFPMEEPGVQQLIDELDRLLTLVADAQGH